MSYLTDAADFVAAQKLELAGRNLKHLLKIQEEQASLENIVATLKQTVIDAHANNPMDLCDMMVLQARLLDGLFHYYLDNGTGKYTEDTQVEKAMRAQAQTVRTLHAWKKLKEQNYIKHKIIRYSLPEKKSAQNELDKSQAKHATLDT